MSISLPTGYRWDPALSLGSETTQLTARLWPNYLVQDSDIPEAGLRIEISPQEFARRFPVWGIRHEETGKLVAFANGVQLALDLSTAALPEAGWTFAIQSAGSPGPRNCLCLLVANVDPSARGLGLSKILISRAKLAAEELGFSTMIAPVRPLLKHTAPFSPMSEYVARKFGNGKSYDPWIDLHARSGGKIVNICSESVRVRASLKKWRQWTGLPLSTPGDHLLPAGLVPLKVDMQRNIGVYTEPNVWMRYKLA